jgi:glycosyltransferase involved in cell wall biosynthesis
VKKILIVHNKYQNLGGEDLVVLNETNLLQNKYEVKTIYFKNSTKLEISDYFSLITGSNRKSLERLKKEIKDFKPDAVYFHNLWYKINVKTVLKACRDVKYIFIKQHNLRHECIQGMHFRNDNLCHSCQTKSFLSGIVNRCYHNSIIKSILMTMFSRRYLKLLQNKKIKVLTFSNFHIKKLVSNKIDENSIYKLNNFLSLNDSIDEKIDLPENFICFVGRASKEKGIPLIIEAYKNSNLKNTKLLIVGKVDEEISDLTIEDNQNILFKNEITNQQVKYLIEKSKAIVLGSIAYEGHPVILSEGIMANTILICPLFSGIDELMPEKYDYFYQHNSSIDLTKALNRLADFEMYQENKQELLKFKKEKYRDSLFFSQFEKIIN